MPFQVLFVIYILQILFKKLVLFIINVFCIIDNPYNIFGQKMKQQCEDRLKYFETGEKPPKNVDVMHDACLESQRQVFKF